MKHTPLINRSERLATAAAILYGAGLLAGVAIILWGLLTLTFWLMGAPL